MEGMGKSSEVTLSGFSVKCQVALLKQKPLQELTCLVGVSQC